MHPIENATDHPWRLEEDEKGKYADGEERDEPAHDCLAYRKGRATEAADQGLEPRHVLFDVALQMQALHQVTDLSFAVLRLADEARQLLREARC